MPSLKTYAPVLSARLGLTSAAIYERQRVLARDGLILSRDGKGPGSGFAATAESICWSLLAVLSSKQISEAGIRAREISALKPIQVSKCGLTNKSTFGAALTAVLEVPELAARVREIVVSQNTLQAHIRYSRGEKVVRSSFEGISDSHPMVTEVRLNGHTINDISKDITAMASEIEDNKGTLTEPEPNKKKMRKRFR